MDYNIGGRPISRRKYVLGVTFIIALFIGIILVAIV